MMGLQTSMSFENTMPDMQTSNVAWRANSQMGFVIPHQQVFLPLFIGVICCDHIYTSHIIVMYIY